MSKPAAKLAHVTLSLGITGVLLYFVFREQNFQDFIEILKRTDLSLFFAYLSFSLLALYFRAIRYGVLLRSMLGVEKTPSVGKLLIVTAVRNALVDFVPARMGELSFFYILKRYGVNIVSAVSTFGLCIALDVIVLAFILIALVLISPLVTLPTASAGAAATSLSLSSLGVYLLVFLAMVVVGLLIVFRLDRYSLSVSRYLSQSRWFESSKLKRALVTLLENVATDVSRAREQGSFWRLVLLTVGLRVGKYGSLYFLLLALVKQWGFSMADISPLMSFLAFVSAEASASLPVSGFMGFGAYEAAWTAIFALSGVEIPSPTSVVFGVHLLTQIVGYLVGLVGLCAFSLTEGIKTFSTDEQL